MPRSIDCQYYFNNNKKLITIYNHLLIVLLNFNFNFNKNLKLSSK